MIKMNMPPGGIFKKFPLVCVMVLDLILYGGSGAAALPDVLKTKVTVNQEAKLLSVAVQDRVLTVAVLPGENHENPFIDISGWDSEKRFQVAFSDVASVIFIDLYEILPGFKTAILPVDMGWVTHVRLGHHADRLRIAIDGRHSDFPQARAVRREDGLVITLDSEKKQAMPSAASVQKPLAPVLAAIESTEPRESDSKKPAPSSTIRTSHIFRQALEDISEPVTTPENRLFQDAVSCSTTGNGAWPGTRFSRSLTSIRKALYGKSPISAGRYSAGTIWGRSCLPFSGIDTIFSRCLKPVSEFSLQRGRIAGPGLAASKHGKPRGSPGLL